MQVYQLASEKGGLHKTIYNRGLKGYWKGQIFEHDE